MAEQLAVKKYLSLLLNDLIQEEKALSLYLHHHKEASPKINQLLNELPGYKELLAPHFQPLSQELSDWMNATYDKNLAHPEHLIHKTSTGHLVRSKSEAMIAHFLSEHQIPFRYECALQLGTLTIYPDFTIRHPETGDYIYWEHFGMMDDSSYARKTASKLQLYISNGIIPSIQLITTYETQGHPLSTEVIQRTIEDYLL